MQAGKIYQGILRGLELVQSSEGALTAKTLFCVGLTQFMSF
jgi:hypothetical protein